VGGKTRIREFVVAALEKRAAPYKRFGEARISRSGTKDQM
jgi:hypothetical protein